MSFAAAILAFIKAIPAIESIYVQTIDLYFKALGAIDVKATIKMQGERDAILKEMARKEVTFEELKNLRRKLYNLTRK